MTKNAQGKLKNELTFLVREAYKEVLDSQEIRFEKPGKIGEDTPIYGNNGYIDSLGLVNLVVAIEERMQEKFNVFLSLASEKAMSRTKSPFRDVKSLSLYLKELLKEKTDE